MSDNKDNIRQKIIDHAKDEYFSSPHEYTDEELNIIIDSDCKCDSCGKSIFELDDFPVVRDNCVYCENCYDETYSTICPICEDKYEEDDQTDYFFITKRTKKETRQPIGLYKAIKKPFFYGDIVCGFEGFYDDAIEQVNDLDIDEYFEARQAYKKEVSTDLMCPNCAERFQKGSGFMFFWPHYIILLKEFEEECKKKYGDSLHFRRMQVINSNINAKGMLERANNPKYKKI